MRKMRSVRGMRTIRSMRSRMLVRAAWSRMWVLWLVTMRLLIIDISLMFLQR